MRRFLAFVGAVVVVVMIAAGAFNLLAAAAKHTFDVRTSYAGVSSLEVDAGSGDVRLIGAPAGSPVSVVGRVSAAFATPHLRALRPGPGVLRLTYRCGTSVDCAVSYTVAVPAGVAVTANGGDGDVQATGLASPRVTLESGNGDVTAALSQAATSLTASSGSGDVTLTVPDVSYSVRASSGNGAVSDGALTIDPHSSRRIDASSGDGDVTINTVQ